LNKKSKKENTLLSESEVEKKENESLAVVTSTTRGNVLQFDISLNTAELTRRIETGTLIKEHPPQGNDIRDIAGFYCQTDNSANGIYTVCFCDGDYKDNQWQSGILALVKGKEKLYHIRIQRPNTAHVSNNGIVVCADWVNSNELVGNFIALDISGKILFERKVNANMGETAISADSTIAVFDTYYSENEDSSKVFIIDLSQKRIFSQFERQFEMSSAIIDTEKKRVRFSSHKGYIYETDYFGNQTNLEEYEELVWKFGSIYEKMQLFEKLPVQERNKNNKYIPLLESAMNDPEIISSNYQAIVYRKLGEFYESQNDISTTIKYFEKAVAADPKIGVKRKLDKYKKGR
jgi:hypothetical protein